jgi:hypothetical protein
MILNFNERKIYYLFLVLFVFSVSCYLLFKARKVKENGRYILAVVTKIKEGSKGGSRAFYNYTIGDKIFETSCSLLFGKEDSFYLLQYEVSNPANVIFLDVKLPFCIDYKILPDSGWDKLPACLPYIKPNPIDYR